MSLRPAALAVPFAAGGATAVALGIYSSVHEATGRSLLFSGFESTASWKSALASVVVILFMMQVSLGLRMVGRVGGVRPVAPWARDLHRLVGTLAFGLSIPVVFHCLWALGFQTTDSRVSTHSILGCVAYGLYVTKILSARRPDRPEWALPVTGAFLGITMIVVWWSAALTFYVGGS
ncbi:MAG: hypothetical protein ACI9MX_002080 [Candidatus Aldehydirespiratoraceae bacterium]